ncbi:3-ketoacyl-CoA synthase 17 [Abeliophyllum distichum]|uniref:3-ketoacyl-CoA synthase n=1 Tax=Abeliophyllum distichum TaxID=126358 RepID=A0ABD1TDE4_9LAMI
MISIIFPWNDFPSIFLDQSNKLIFGISLLCLVILILIVHGFFKRPLQVFLVDIACYKPPSSLMCSNERFISRMRCYGGPIFDEETVEFMEKLLERSGLGDSTYGPPALLSEPPEPSLEAARAEAEMVVFGAIDELLAKTKIKSDQIGILVVNCCVFSVVPSLSSMIVNRYKFKDNILSYNLTGMGCSAGLRAIGLSSQLLQVHRDTYVLVVSTENMTQNFYLGNDRPKNLVCSAFRVGGAAILLSNVASDSRSSKYKLLHNVHTHKASCDSSYNCIFQEEDDKGNLGISVTRDLVISAAKAIQSNIKMLAPLVLPLSEQIYYAINNYVTKHLHLANFKPYKPNFSRAVDHFFPHLGAKFLLDELQKKMGFSDEQMEAARMTLYRYGNTSSSSVWYEMAYAEAKGRVKKGHILWQISFGSGFKCSSVVWRAIKNVDIEKMNPWSDEIDGFPVNLSNINSSYPYKFENS